MYICIHALVSLFASELDELTNIANALDEVYKMSACITNTAIIMISDFLNIIKDSDPADSVKSLTDRNVKVSKLSLFNFVIL